MSYTCKFCYTSIDRNATVCKGCGAEKVLISPEGPYSWKRAILSAILIFFIFTGVAIWMDLGNVFATGVLLSPFLGILAGGGDKAVYQWQR